MPRPGKKGQTRAASSLLHTSPSHACDMWKRSASHLETTVVLRARAHAVQFALDTPHFPKYYSASPARGVIPAHDAVEVVVRLRLTERTRRSAHQHARGSSFWTELRVRVRRAGAAAEEDWEEEREREREREVAGKAGRQRSRGRAREGRALGGPAAEFVRTLRLRPLEVGVGTDCCICFGPMCARRHAAGVEDERLFGLGCGHVFHAVCVIAMAEAGLCGCGCGASPGVVCPLCRRGATSAEEAIIRKGMSVEEFGESWSDGESGGPGDEQASMYTGGHTSLENAELLAHILSIEGD